MFSILMTADSSACASLESTCSSSTEMGVALVLYGFLHIVDGLDVFDVPLFQGGHLYLIALFADLVPEV